ncbi:excisionase family DNA-binding protein [Liquorilactobacillus aquaticus]|uniref:excisionase family DNA-binding protein n=1 Tax=Liquorilactobacillus aquaticus TaxID=392566 RepID=UPI00070C6C76|nr:excisionase family DNA-binding protein [Liquorilactobacillus aquaticus]
MKQKIQNKKLQLLSIPQTARLLNVKRETIEMWLQDPEVPRLFVGRSKQVRLPQKQFFEYLDSRAKDWPQYQ